MIMAISIIYFIYILLKVYISVMQAGYVLKAKDQKAVLMLPSKFYKSGRYAAKKEKVAMLEAIVQYVTFLFWIGFGLQWLDSWINIDNLVLKSVIFIDIFLAINYIIGLPFDFYQKFVLDEEFGFNKSTISLFLKDQIKGAILFIVFGSIVIGAISYIILNFQNWWIWGFVFVFVLIIFINAIYPTIIAPIFNKFTPLKDEKLKNDIDELLNRCGFKSNGVYVVDASKRDSRLNAYFGGLGKSKRVVLFDTLIDKLSRDELLAVLGHELGHFAHKDILKNIFMMGVMMFALFYIFGNLPQQLFNELGIKDTPWMIEALFLLLSPVFTFFFMPLINFVSRKNEYAADEHASALTSRSSLRNALLKLVDENAQFPLSHPFYIFFYYSHPPVIERLKALGYDENRKDLDEALKESCIAKEMEDEDRKGS